MDAHRRAQCLIGAFNRRQNETGMSAAENNRRHHDVQTVKASGRKEARQSLSPALDEHAA